MDLRVRTGLVGSFQTDSTYYEGRHDLLMTEIYNKEAVNDVFKVSLLKSIKNCLQLDSVEELLPVMTKS